MKNECSIQVPVEVLLGLNMSAEALGDWMKKQAAIILFKEGKLSSGMASRWLNMPRVKFLFEAMEAGATLLDDTEDDFKREASLL